MQFTYPEASSTSKLQEKPSALKREHPALVVDPGPIQLPNPPPPPSTVSLFIAVAVAVGEDLPEAVPVLDELRTWRTWRKREGLGTQ